MTDYPVSVHQDSNYGGDSTRLKYTSRKDVSDLGIKNDSISSVKVAPFTLLVLYQNFKQVSRTIFSNHKILLDLWL